MPFFYYSKPLQKSMYHIKIYYSAPKFWTCLSRMILSSSSPQASIIDVILTCSQQLPVTVTEEDWLIFHTYTYVLMRWVVADSCSWTYFPIELAFGGRPKVSGVLSFCVCRKDRLMQKRKQCNSRALLLAMLQRSVIKLGQVKEVLFCQYIMEVS